MASPSIGGIFRIGVDVLRTTVSAKTKAVLAQIGDTTDTGQADGDAVAGLTETDDVEWWQHVGYVSRPSKADAGVQSCQALVIRDSKNDVCFSSRDLRGLELAGSLREGETCVYGPGADGKAQGRMLIKDNGNVTLYTTKGNTATGTSVTIQCNADGTIYLASEFGALSIDSSAVKIAHVSGAGAQIDSSGVALLGKSLALNGSSVALGNGAGTGVLTQLSTLPFSIALTAAGASAAAFAVAFAAFVDSQDDPTIKNSAKAAGTAFGASLVAAALAFVSPTNVSLNVKSS